MPDGLPRPPPLGRTLRDADALAAAGLVPAEALPILRAVAARYAVSVTPAMAALIDPADPDDPIAAQYLPHAAELESTPAERPDPIADAPTPP